MTTSYQSSWWSIELAPGWSGQHDEECHTFVRGREPVSALQISTYRKEEGDVTDAEIKDFGVKKHLDAGCPVHPIAISTFRGFYVSHVRDGVCWREWHLHDGRLLLFVTYNCDEAQKGIEDAEVDGMLKTIKVIDE